MNAKEAKQQKKLEKRSLILQQRKLKSEKREQYLEILKQHEIKPEEKRLMRSSKDAGQTLSTKKHVQLLFQKHKLGLPLTTEEMNVLFYENKMADERGENGIDSVVDNTNENDSKMIVDKENEDKKDNEMDIVDIMAIVKNTAKQSMVTNNKDNILENSNKNDNKNNMDSKIVSNNNSDVSKDVTENIKDVKNPLTSFKTLGSSLLSHFNKIKEKQSKSSLESKEKEDSDEDEEEESDEKEEVVKETVKYVPSAVVEPVTELGLVQPLDGSSLSTSDNEKQRVSASATSSKHRVVHVTRNSRIQATRLSLPICGMEQELVEAVNEHDCVIVSGETGSGKSTQLPQFLYEAGYCRAGLIGVTEPRRVAAVATASRVSYELTGEYLDDREGNKAKSRKRGKKKSSEKARASSESDDKPPSKISRTRNTNYGRLKPLNVGAHAQNRNQESNDLEDEDLEKMDEEDEEDEEGGEEDDCIDGLVGYQIRFESKRKASTKILFMTDGILLREVSSDLLLRKYSVIIIDEAHERSINTDVLLGMLSRTLQLRRTQAVEESLRWAALSEEERTGYCSPLQPLKLVIMSATLRVEDFQAPQLFPKPPPVLAVQARQFPVDLHFERRTNTSMTDYIDQCRDKVMQIHTKLPAGGILVFVTGKKEIYELIRKIRAFSVSANSSRGTRLNSGGACAGRRARNGAEYRQYACPGPVRPARPARCAAAAREIQRTRNSLAPPAVNSRLRSRPLSTTYFMPGIVSEVSATLVLTTISRLPAGKGAKIFCCRR